jgi:uncharacterized glyoxalase superfamily protein PhnB
MDDPFRRAALTAGRQGSWAALDWLQKAFGFERSRLISDKDGKLGHAEMRSGDRIVALSSTGGEP